MKSRKYKAFQYLTRIKPNNYKITLVESYFLWYRNNRFDNWHIIDTTGDNK